MRIALVLLLALIGALASASADAAVVTTFSYDEEDDPGDIRPDVYTVYVLRFTATAGERNNVSVRRTGEGRYAIHDSGAKLKARGGCRRGKTVHDVTCEVGYDDADLRFLLGGGNDRLRAAGVGVEVDGGPGNDTITGSQHTDFLHGGTGNDRIDGKSGDDSISGDAGADRIQGGRGIDELDGGTGADKLFGGPGNDRITAADGARKLGNDMIDGGPGSADRVSYAPRKLGVSVSLTTERGGSNGERDTYKSIERVIGTPFDDSLTGDDGPNVLDGGSGGYDVYDGRAGNDLILSTSYYDATYKPLGGDVTCGLGDDRVENVSAPLLLRPDCEQAGQPTRKRAQPLAVTADSITVDVVCNGTPVRLTLPAAGPKWAGAGPFDMVLATGKAPGPGTNPCPPLTLPLTPAGQAEVAAHSGFPVTLTVDNNAWSLLLTR